MYFFFFYFKNLHRLEVRVISFPNICISVNSIKTYFRFFVKRDCTWYKYFFPLVKKKATILPLRNNNATFSSVIRQRKFRWNVTKETFLLLLFYIFFNAMMLNSIWSHRNIDPKNFKKMNFTRLLLKKYYKKKKEKKQYFFLKYKFI